MATNLAWLLSVLIHPYMPGISEEIQRQLQVGLVTVSSGIDIWFCWFLVLNRSLYSTSILLIITLDVHKSVIDEELCGMATAFCSLCNARSQFLLLKEDLITDYCSSLTY